MAHAPRGLGQSAILLGAYDALTGNVPGAHPRGDIDRKGAFVVQPLHLSVGVVLSAIAMLAFGPAETHAAAGTTCLCRTSDDKGFTERTLRHSRWICDYRLGYALAQGEKGPGVKRPSGQTCNAEEITQIKVWLCIENGCTYPYARSTETKNRRLERIENLKGPRRP